MTIETQVTLLIGMAIATLFAVFTKYTLDIIEYVKSKSKASGYGWAVNMAIEAGCEMAEKMFQSGEGQKKLEFVLQYAEDEAKRMGIKFDKVQATEIINKYVEDVINAARKVTDEEVKQG